MDIEGFEYEVFSGWKWTTSCHFPDQISVEIHWNVGLFFFVRTLLHC